MARRNRSSAAKPKGPGSARWMWIAGAVTVAAVAGFIALQDEGPAEGFEDNFASFGLADDPFYGNASAPVAVVAFEAPQCSACKAFHNGLLPQLKAEYADTGRAALYYVQSTIGNDGDFPGGIAQECALRHGGNAPFWSLTDRLYARGDTYSVPDHRAMLRQVAATHGLDAQTLIACYDDQDTHRAVSRDWRIGEDHGVRGTPTFFVFGPEGRAEQVRAEHLAQVIEELSA